VKQRWTGLCSWLFSFQSFVLLFKQVEYLNVTMCEHRHLTSEIGIIEVNAEVMFYSLMQEFSIKSAQIRQN